MAVTAAAIKELREITGVGMSDCKKALVECEGNIEKAVEFLREQGLAAAQKKAGRVAAEGLVKASIDGNVGVVVEINSETDFVAMNEKFVEYVAQVSETVAKKNIQTVEELLKAEWDYDEFATVEEAHNNKIAVIGENLTLRRIARVEANENEQFVSYIHGGGKVAVLVTLGATEMNSEIEEAGKNVAMQIAAMNPKFVDSSQVSKEFIESEKNLLMQQAINEGSTPEIAEKKVIGRLNKQLKQFCLVDQEYVKGDKQSVADYLKEVSKAVGTEVTVKNFIRFETGEGIEKKEENFAEEVNKTING